MLLALTVLFFLTTVLFGLMALAPKSAPIKTDTIERAAQTSTEDDIRDVASRFAENVLTYNFRTVEADTEKAARDATTEFAARPQPAFAGKNLAGYRKDITDADGTSQADIKSTSVTSRDDDTSTVLVVANRTFDSNKREPTTGLLVLELTLVNTSDGWKVDNAANPASAN